MTPRRWYAKCSPLKREALTPDTLGLGLAEAKDLLAAVQDTLVSAPISAAVAAQDTCPDCARPYRRSFGRLWVGVSLHFAGEVPDELPRLYVYARHPVRCVHRVR